MGKLPCLENRSSRKGLRGSTPLYSAAVVVELADREHLKRSVFGRAGSSPAYRTNFGG